LEHPPSALPQSALPHGETSAEIDSALSSSCVVDEISSAGLAASPETPDDATQDADATAWRDELSARLNRYRSRRKARPPRYPSLNLQFEPLESSSRTGVPSVPALPDYEPVSDHALALDGMRQDPPAPVAGKSTQLQQPPAREPAPQIVSTPAHSGAKIIEFPRFAWGPPPPPPDQLAGPVVDRPRILEVPETAPPAPALGGITIEAAQREEAEKRPGIDIPLQSAPLSRRLIAGIVDGLIIATASALFGYIFWKVAAVRPPLVQILGMAAGVTSLFWAAYQYLLIVYAATTPGLRAAGLELARFDGSIPKRRLRRWRVLASYLSAVSLGMGYAWVFLDEDALCWHDRITHTYLAPKKGAAAGLKQTP
jgi:uncharacterized RDD family membrane protein YckC